MAGYRWAGKALRRFGKGAKGQDCCCDPCLDPVFMCDEDEDPRMCCRECQDVQTPHIVAELRDISLPTTCVNLNGNPDECGVTADAYAKSDVAELNEDLLLVRTSECGWVGEKTVSIPFWYYATDPCDVDPVDEFVTLGGVVTYVSHPVTAKPWLSSLFWLYTAASIQAHIFLQEARRRARICGEAVTVSNLFAAYGCGLIETPSIGAGLYHRGGVGGTCRLVPCGEVGI